MIMKIDVLLLKNKLYWVVLKPLLLLYKRLARKIWITQLRAHLNPHPNVLENRTEKITLQYLLVISIQAPQILNMV
jgi:hypothetical protein